MDLLNLFKDLLNFGRDVRKRPRFSFFYTYGNFDDYLTLSRFGEEGSCFLRRPLDMV